jgi:hypothetical protein
MSHVCCKKIAEAEAAVSVNEKKWLVMHMHVQLRLDELRGPPCLTCVAKQAMGQSTLGLCENLCRSEFLPPCFIKQHR